MKQRESVEDSLDISSLYQFFLDCERFRCFIFVSGKSAPVYVYKLICIAISALFQDRDRRIVLIMRLDLLLKFLEEYFEQIATTLGKDGAFFDTLEKYAESSHKMRFFLFCFFVFSGARTSFMCHPDVLLPFLARERVVVRNI